MYASTVADASLTTELLDRGADPNAHDPFGRTALGRPSRAGHAQTVAVLLALMTAVRRGHMETVRALLSGGANVNAATDSGSTARMLAEAAGHSDIVDVLRAAGAKR